MSPVRFATLALLLSAVFLVCTVAQAWAQSPFPDGVRFTDSGTVLKAGQNYSIGLQVLLGGGDYPKGNIGIYLVTDNTSVIAIPETAMTVTDQNGTAVYNLTADEIKPGTATLTAIILDKRTGPKVSRQFTVVTSGNITGKVTDEAGVPVQAAAVTVYQSVNGTNSVVAAEGNPAVSASNVTGNPGSFTINGIPYGSYYVEASIAGAKSGVDYTLDNNAQPLTIAVKGYLVTTPTPVPSVNVTPQPGATATTVPTPSQSSGDSGKQMIWIGGLAIILTIVFLVIAALTRKK